MSQNTSLGFTPFSNVSGLLLSVTSDSTLTVTSGQCRDSDNAVDMILPSDTILDAETNGANGLDQGDLAASTWYKVFVISSSGSLAPSALLLSTSATPLMPFNYDSKRYIGSVLTDGSVDFLACDIYGNGNLRKYIWDAVVTELNAAGNTSFTDVDLASSVAPTSTLVYLNWKFVPNTAGNLANLRKKGSSSVTNIEITGSVASQPNTGNILMNTSTAQVIQYITAHASDDLTLLVQGFEEFI